MTECYAQLGIGTDEKTEEIFAGLNRKQVAIKRFTTSITSVNTFTSTMSVSETTGYATDNFQTAKLLGGCDLHLPTMIGCGRAVQQITRALSISGQW